jgi:hypothetical protein
MKIAAPILTLVLAASPLPAQTPDFSGVDGFWKIAAILQRDEEPPAAMWDALFGTPGYAALDARERRRPAITLGMRAALRPSLAHVRDSILPTGSWTARVIRHIQTLPARRLELDSVRARLVGGDFLADALARAATLLPADARGKHGSPAVAFIFFLPDGRGYPDVLVADLANIANKTDVVPFFAHEATHFYFGRIARERDVRPQTPGDSAVLRMLTKLFEESVGDQHDKAPILAMSDEAFARARMDDGWRAYMTQYRAHYKRAADELARVDAVLAHAGAAGDSVVRLVADSLNRALPLEGRPLGFHITSRIRAAKGDAVLRATIGDPVAWVDAYIGAGGRLQPTTLGLVRRLRGQSR